MNRWPRMAAFSPVGCSSSGRGFFTASRLRQDGQCRGLASPEQHRLPAAGRPARAAGDLCFHGWWGAGQIRLQGTRAGPASSCVCTGNKI